MRLFFGLELEQHTLRAVADWRDRQFSYVARPVPPANFHITLAFIGEIRESKLERVCLDVERWLERDSVTGATFTLNRMGYWPRPGIYWLGPDTWPPQLSRLAEKLMSLAAAAGSKRDKRPFQPHITLFRNCLDAPPAPAVTPAITVSYHHFSLFESKQGKRGVGYYPRHAWDLLPES